MAEAGQGAAVTVRLGSLADREATADALGRAFADDPVYRWLAHPRRPTEAIRDLLLGDAGEYLPLGHTWVAETEGAIIGAALWRPPPGARASTMLGRVHGLWPLRRLTGLARWPRMYETVRRTEARYPREPHAYLAVLGVQPGAQSRGVGARLVTPMLDRLDDEGLPAYLESSNPRNLSFYRRQGFRDLDVLRLPFGGPPLTLMWRDPRPGES